MKVCFKCIAMILAVAVSFCACSSESSESAGENNNTVVITTEKQANITSTSGTTASQTTTTVESTPQVVTTAPIVIDTSAMAYVDCTAQYYMVYDLTDDVVLYSTDETESFYPASVTKLVTALFALTIASPDDVFTVGKELYSVPSDSSVVGIKIGEMYTLESLLYGMLLPSGNDAARSVAANCGKIIAGDQTLAYKNAMQIFMDAMNEYMKNTLQMTSSNFVTPDGYHDEEHTTTLADMLNVIKEVSRNDYLMSILSADEYVIEAADSSKMINVTNTNLLILEESSYYYEYAVAGKTGFHTPAGSCVVAFAEKDGRELAVLVFNSSDKLVRFTDAANLFEAAFDLYEVVS